MIPWYADIINYLVTEIMSNDFNKANIDLLKSEAEYSLQQINHFTKPNTHCHIITTTYNDMSLDTL